MKRVLVATRSTCISVSKLLGKRRRSYSCRSVRLDPILPSLAHRGSETSGCLFSRELFFSHLSSQSTVSGFLPIESLFDSHQSSVANIITVLLYQLSVPQRSHTHGRILQECFFGSADRHENIYLHPRSRKRSPTAPQPVSVPNLCSRSHRRQPCFGGLELVNQLPQNIPLRV
jgi:hypothetical protein